jgi:hypothetical protein
MTSLGIEPEPFRVSPPLLSYFGNTDRARNQTISSRPLPTSPWKSQSSPSGLCGEQRYTNVCISPNDFRLAMFRTCVFVSVR